MKTMEYVRVIPRDLFNEAKLLKCIGRLCLLIHDNTTPCPMAFVQSEDGEPFNIGLSEEGSLFVTNIHISIKGKIFPFKTTYNSKANYPLYLEYEYCDYLVFDEQGNWDAEFIAFCETVSGEEPEPERPVIKVDSMADFEF